MSKNYAVLVRGLDGKLLGRLTPEGGVTKRRIFAAMLDKDTAEKVAEEINAEGNYTAKEIKF